MRTQDMNGKVALVTGASSGIGRASARAFAEHGAGLIVADVAVSSGEETVQLIESSGGTARFVETDVSYESMVATMEHHRGGVRERGLCSKQCRDSYRGRTSLVCRCGPLPIRTLRDLQPSANRGAERQQAGDLVYVRPFF